MKLIRAKNLAQAQGFKVLDNATKCQIAIMRLGDGETSGEFGNEHPESDQVLYVIEGGGRISIEEEEVELLAGDVAIIPAQANHQVIGPNLSLNFYAPAAY